MIEVLTISTSGTACGIAEYFGHLRDASPGDVHFRCNVDWLDPAVFFAELPSIQEYQGPQVVWLNYHAALHSRWDSRALRTLATEHLLTHGRELPIVVTYHDTGVPNSEQCRAIYTTVDAVGGAFIVHEPCDDLPHAIYLRQGVPPAGIGPEYQWHNTERPPACYAQPAVYWLGVDRRPILGSVGFPFPWKNYDLLAEATALAGWSLLLLAPGATEGQIARWRELNPMTAVEREFIKADRVVRQLNGCDATAFLYMCANTGTSGAIRQGIAARKPVLATAGCRQFRDLEEDDLGSAVIRWLHDLSPVGVASALCNTHLSRLDTGIHALAERDSWSRQAAIYADIFRSLVA